MIGCVGRGPSALLCLGAYYAVKTALVQPLFTFCNELRLRHIGYLVWHVNT